MVAALRVLLLLVVVTQIYGCSTNGTAQCNDGNNVNLDGCDKKCQIEEGWRCPANETLGDCVCYCVKSDGTCGCSWTSTGSGGPLTGMPDFERVGFEFDVRTQKNKIMQGIKFTRTGCNKFTHWFQKDKTQACANNAGTSLNEGLTLNVAAVDGGSVDYNVDNATWVNWVGSPMTIGVTGLERLAFKCPPGKVPTALYFERAGCNTQQANFSTWALGRRLASDDYPGCLANSQSFNDGLSLVAVCRPEASLARGMWMWIDAGYAAPVVNPSDLSKLGGLCPNGYAVTGAYFNARGCGQNLQWQQLLSRSEVAPKCPKLKPGEPLKNNGLQLRLHCTRFGKDIHECGPLSSHTEWPCDDDAQCLNSEFGGTRCVCNPGFDGIGRNGTCRPINPCALNANICPPRPGGQCNYLGPGKYNCTCRPGYQSVNGGCKAIGLTSNNNTAVYPSFQAKCTFGGRPDSTVSGSFTFQSQRNPTTGDAQGTMIDVSLSGSRLKNVYRWDIRRDTVDTAEDLGACWSAGPIFSGAGIGFTSKYGKIPLTPARYFDSDIMLFGRNSVVGRSIVLETEDGDYIACCTIHLVGASGGSPAAPSQAATASRADCNFADGRTVQLYQQRNYIGSATGAAGQEDLHYQSIGTTWKVNQPTVVFSSMFTSAADARQFATPTSGAVPPLSTCSSGRPFLGGLTEQTAGRWLEYRITNARLFRQVKIQGSFWFLGVWRGEVGMITIRVTNSNPPLDFVVWSQAYSGTGPCTDGSNNRVQINTIYTLDMPRSNVIIRFHTTLGSGSTGSFALTSYSHSTNQPFSITLQPVLAEQSIRNRKFTGQDDLSSWTKIDASGARSPPVVGQCTTPSQNYSLLGGLSVLKSTDVLEFKQTTASYLRLNIAFTFWFQKGWSGQTVVIEMFKQSAPAETIQVWSKVGNNQPGSSIRCGGVGTDYFEFVNVTKTFQQQTDQVLIRIRITGTLSGTASWGLSSWSVQTLPTQSSWDIFQDRFRAGAKSGWFLGNRAITDSDFIYCDDGSSKWWGNYYSLAFDDRSIRGGKDFPITYNSVTTRNFTRGMITFSIHLLDQWSNNQHFVYFEVTNLGQLWKYSWDRSFAWRRPCTWGDNNRGWGHSQYVSVPFTFPSPVTNMQLKWTTNLPNDRNYHSFVISSLQLTTYPDNAQLNDVNAAAASSAWTAGNVAFGGHGAGPTQLPPSGPVTTKVCTIPTEYQATNADSGRDHTLLGFRQFRNGAVRYRYTHSRPFQKAIAHYYYWFLDIWGPDYAFLRQHVFNPVTSASPMRWLFREVHYYSDNYSPRQNFPCGGLYDGRTHGWGTHVRRHAVAIFERTANTNVELYWQSTIPHTNGYASFAVSNLKMTYFPPVEVVTLVSGLQNQFDSSAGRAPFKLYQDGQMKDIQTATCSSGSGTNQVLFGSSIRNGGADIRWVSPTQTRAFRQIRVSFRMWYIGNWNGERATLYTAGAGGEPLDNIWRGDHRSDYQWNWVNNQRTNNNYCSIPRYGATGWWERYEDVMVESTFNTPIKQVTLVWGNKLTYGENSQSMGISHVNIQIVPETFPVPVETSNFISTGDSLDGWNMFKDGQWTKPVVTACGAGNNDALKEHLVGGRTRLGPVEKLKFETTASDAKAPFKVAHVYFRYWFLPTWGANDQGTLSVREFGKPTEVATWSMKYPFALANQVIDCNNTQTTGYRDIGLTIRFPAPTRNVLQFTFGVSSATGSLSPRFAISAFKLDVEKPDPDWALQAGCPGSTYRPADGHNFAAAGLNFGLGDLKNKHGQFNTKEFIDNGIPLSGPFNVIGKSIALYEPGTNTGATCCVINRVATTPAPVAPLAIPFVTAGCVWKNANTEGYMSLRSPSDSGKGSFINVMGRFFGTEASNSHHFSINQRGFSLVDNAGGKCPTSITGDIYGSGAIPDDFIGPSSAGYGLGNPAFPGVAGSSRARIGDLSSKWGRLPGTMRVPYSFTDAQVLLNGPYSVVGRSVVIMSVTGTPLACCTIGFGPVGGPTRGLDYFDALGNYTQPQVADYPRYLNPLDVDDEATEELSPQAAGDYPFWNAGRIAAITVGCVAAALLAGAVAASAAAPGGAAAVDAGEGYVAM